MERPDADGAGVALALVPDRTAPEAMMTDLTEMRRKAWKTRRLKYGDRGHGSDYARRCSQCQRMTDVIVKLHAEGVLSEGQAVSMTGLDRVSVRKLADSISA